MYMEYIFYLLLVVIKRLKRHSLLLELIHTKKLSTNIHAYVYATSAGQKYDYLSSDIAKTNYFHPCECECIFQKK